MLLIVASILVGIVLSSFYRARMVEEYCTKVVALRAARSASADMYGLIQAAETGQRGYLLTQSDRFLEPYQEALTDLAERMKGLETSLEKEATYSSLLPRIRLLLDEKLAEMKRTLDMARAGDVSGAIEIVEADYGRQLMEDLRGLLQNLIQSLEVRLNASVEELSFSSRTMQDRKSTRLNSSH